MTFKWNLDDLHSQPEMNYTGIDQFWTDQGYNEDNLPIIYNNLFICKIIIFIKIIILIFLLFSSAHYLSARAHWLLCDGEDEKEFKLEEAARRRAAEHLGEILRRNETRLRAGDQLRGFVPHHKWPRVHHHPNRHGHMVDDSHDFGLRRNSLNHFRIILSARHDYHHLREPTSPLDCGRIWK